MSQCRNVVMSYLLILVVLYCEPLKAQENPIHWGPWTQFTKRPVRDCIFEEGAVEYRRHCVDCSKPRACVPVERGNCEGMSRKFVPFGIGQACHGDGEFVAKTTPWEAHGECPGEEGPCAETFIKYTRKCIRFDGVAYEDMNNFKCHGAEKLEKREKCPCVISRDENVPEVSTEGTWTQWSHWDCSKPPTDDKILRKRQCEGHGSDYFCRPDAEGRMSSDAHPAVVNNEPTCKKTWGHWKVWSTCPKEDCKAMRTRKRECVGFGRTCEGEDGEVEKCPNESCGKVWSNWSFWSSCSISCGAAAVRYRERDCVGGGRECEGGRTAMEPCPYDKTLCPTVDGNWGPWTEWSEACSVTCGSGVIERTRKCDNPIPSGPGAPCDGDEREIQYCKADDCPIDGQWAEWGGWICGKACNATSSKRERTCIDPIVSYGGRICSGGVYGRQTVTRCTNMPCPLLGELDSDNKDRIKSMLKSNLMLQHKSYKVDGGGTVAFVCDSYGATLIIDYFPSANITWLKDGHQISNSKRFSISQQDRSLNISDADVSDTGSYICQIQYSDDPPETLDIFPLIVNSSTTTSVKYGTTLSLDCHAESLTKLFQTLRQIWTHNKTAAIVRPEPVKIMKFSQADYNMSGVWTCQIYDMYTCRFWTTNLVKVVVQDEIFDKPAALKSRVVRGGMALSSLVRGRFILVGLVAIVLVVIGICACVARLRRRKKGGDEPKEVKKKDSNI